MFSRLKNKTAGPGPDRRRPDGRRPDGHDSGSVQSESWVMESSQSRFIEDVIEASQTVPVLVDFHAEWCGPCKQLAPLLEASVRAKKGAVKLVKIDIDKNPALASQLRIQSIPAVIAFVRGQPVNGFMGAVPQSQIEQLITALVAEMGDTGGESSAEQVFAEAQMALENGDISTASALYSRILRDAPDHIEALKGLAQIWLDEGTIDKAEGLIQHFENQAGEEQAKQYEKDLAPVKDRLALLKEAAIFESKRESLQTTIKEEPEHHEARRHLALALYAARAYEDAFDTLLASIRQDRHAEDGAAHQLYLRMLNAMPAAEGAGARRKLSALLFS